MKPAYVTENDAARERLLRITGNLTEEGLARHLSDGWSVAAALIHLAFWDGYYLALLKGWEQTGFTPTPSNADAINASIFNLSHTIPSSAVVQLIQDAAKAIDRKVETLTPELAAAIEKGGSPRILYRCHHRSEHLDEIEAAFNG